MSEVTFDTLAYAKIILHAAKYQHCAVNGVLLADATKIRDGSKNQDLVIVDSVPLFHHSHNLSPMAEIALTQIETTCQSNNRVIAGYYAACENLRDHTVEKCPGQKIAEKIVEHFPSAVFVVIDNQQLAKELDTPAIKVHKYSEGKWKLKEAAQVTLQSPYVLDLVSHLLQNSVEDDLTDFDNYLDDLNQDWTNLGIEKLIASINEVDSFDDKTNEFIS